MKRIVLVILLCAMLWAPAVIASPPDNVYRLEQQMEATVQGGAGHITLFAGTNDVVFSIYTITGQVVRVVRVAADSRVTLELPKGFYIVKCGSQWSRKVVVC